VLKRLKHGVRLTALALGLATTASLAFFVGSFLADGTHTGTAGSGGTGTKTLPITVDFPNAQLTPTQAVIVTAKVENGTSKAVMFKNVSYTVNTGAAGCDPAWFTVKPYAVGTVEAAELPWWEEVLAGKRTATLNYQPGSQKLVNNSATGIKLVMEESGTDQSACEGAPVTLRFKLSS
jgi:hypothetical protein